MKIDSSEINIRQEKVDDYKDVFKLVEEAFKSADNPSPDEQFLVERLRKSDAFIPQLSLVAEYKNTIIGHILLTKLKIKNDSEIFESLALAPVAVLPEFQKKGIGGLLILKAHSLAKKLGFKSIILLVMKHTILDLGTNRSILLL